jgi:hypothetical protein
MATAEAFAPDEPRAEDGDVVNAVAPEQGIVPVIVAVILIGLDSRVLWFSCIVAAAGGAAKGDFASHDGGTLVEVERDIAGEMDGVAAVKARGEIDGAAAGAGDLGNGLVDGGGVVVCAVADGTVLAHVEPASGCGCGGRVHGRCGGHGLGAVGGTECRCRARERGGCHGEATCGGEAQECAAMQLVRAWFDSRCFRDSCFRGSCFRVGQEVLRVQRTG